MKTLGIIACLLGLAMFVASPTYAAPGPKLDWGRQLHAGDTACPSGKTILNVTRKVTNSVDSGTGLNDAGFEWWAKIDYNQQIKVVETAPGEFCATVKSEGSFTSVGGDGPGCANDANCGMPAGRLEAGVRGTFQGGATYTFKGTFSPAGKRTNGNIGTLDHGCDASTAAGCTMPGFSAWRSEYISGVTDVQLPWWGWIYQGGKNGKWANSGTGNSGNITGN